MFTCVIIVCFTAVLCVTKMAVKDTTMITNHISNWATQKQTTVITFVHISLSTANSQNPCQKYQFIYNTYPVDVAIQRLKNWGLVFSDNKAHLFWNPRQAKYPQGSQTYTHTGSNQDGLDCKEGMHVRVQIGAGWGYTWLQGTVLKYRTHWALMWTKPVFKYPLPHLGTGAIPKYKVETLFAGTALAPARSICAHNFRGRELARLQPEQLQRRPPLTWQNYRVALIYLLMTLNTFSDRILFFLYQFSQFFVQTQNPESVLFSYALHSAQKRKNYNM